MWIRPGICYAPLDDGGGGAGDGAGEGEGQGAPGGGSEPAWARALGEQMGGLTGTLRELMQEARTRGQQSPPKQDEEEEDDELPPEELETLDRSAFGKYLVGQVLKAVNKNAVAPINARLDEITTATTGRAIREDVNALASQNKDFWDWKDEMIALANENRGLAPKRLLQLARADNPDKVAKLAAKYNPKPGGDSSRPRRLNFGGLTPSSSGSGSRNQKMSPKDAATAAWTETVAALGGEPDFEDDD